MCSFSPDQRLVSCETFQQICRPTGSTCRGWRAALVRRENNNRQARLASADFACLLAAVNCNAVTTAASEERKVRGMTPRTVLSKSVHCNRPLRDPMVRSKAPWAHKWEGLLLIYSRTLASRPSLNHTDLLETSGTQRLKIRRTLLKRLQQCPTVMGLDVTRHSRDLLFFSFHNREESKLVVMTYVAPHRSHTKFTPSSFQS